jgi:hypothetical protein
MQNNQPSINLAKDKEISSFDRFIDWTLMIGRLIVIVIEVIAVAAFVYRFSLDEKLVNLHTEIKKQQATIISLKNDENKYRNLQDRIALAATFSENSARTSKIITDFGNLIPSQATITSLIFSKSQANIVVDVTSVSLLADLIKSFKTYNGIKSISIDNIENKPSIGLTVNITTTFK